MISNNNRFKVFYSIFATLVMVFFSEASSANYVSSLGNGKYVPYELLIKYKDGARVDRRQRDIYTVKAKVINKFQNFGIEHWVVEDSDLDAVIESLKNNPDIEFVEPNYLKRMNRIPNDEDYDELWGLNNSGQNVNGSSGTDGSDMDLEDAWELETGSSSVVVAVIDNGFETDHSDLEDNFIAGYDVSDSGTDVSPDSEEDTHGTNVAGVIGAVGNNGTGIAGVVWDVSILPIKFGGDIAGEVAAMDYAISQNVDIINFSYGGVTTNSAEETAISDLEDEGILLVVAAGNYDVDNDLVLDYPSCFTNSNIISVAASDQDDAMVYWSQYGQTNVDIMAPGENIYTTDVGDSYDYVDGTSFSAPYVAGVAALIKSHIPSADYQEIKGRIMASADTVSGLNGYLAVPGRANANTALTIDETPVLVIGSIDVVDNENEMLDPGESAYLSIELENVWARADNISATLSSSDSDITIVTDSVNYTDLNPGDRTTFSSAYRISLDSSVTGYKRIPFELEITADDYSVTRSFYLETGEIQPGITYSDTIGEDIFDDVHHYYVYVTDGVDSITVTTESEEDIDILVKKGQFPIFINDGVYGDDGTTYSVNGTTGNEELEVTTATSGYYHIAIVNVNGDEDLDYSFNVAFNRSSSNGGASWYLIFLPLIYLRRKRK